MAYGFARHLDARVLIAHVVTLPSAARALSSGRDARAARRARRWPSASSRRRGLARELGVRAEAVIRTAVSAPEAILALAREQHVDLLVLAANLRQFTGRPFLGHGVEYLLEESESTVVVVTVPPGWGPRREKVRTVRKLEPLEC